MALSAPDEGVIEPLLRGLETPSTREASRRALTTRLQDRPGPTLAAIARGLPRVTDQGTRRRTIETELLEIVAHAVAHTPNPDAYFGQAEGPTPLAAGLARGIARRRPDSRLGGVLLEIIGHGEPSARLEAFRACRVMRPELDRGWFEALVSGLTQAPTRSTAWAALRELSGQDLPATPEAWRGWWRQKTPQALTPAEPWLEGLFEGSRRSRAIQRSVLMRQLIQTPTEVVRSLETIDSTWSAARLEVLEALVAESLVRTDDPGALLGLAHSGCPAVFAAGVARGIGQRASRGAALGREPEPLLRDLLDHDSTIVRVQVYGALPACLEELDDAWFQELYDGLCSLEPRIQRAAWQALRRLSGEDLGQSAVVWERWWEQAEQDEGEGWTGGAPRSGTYSGVGVSYSRSTASSPTRTAPNKKSTASPEPTSSSTWLLGVGLALLFGGGFLVRRHRARPAATEQPVRPTSRLAITRSHDRALLSREAALRKQGLGMVTWKGRRPSQAGMTLLEVVVATAVFSVAVLGLVGVLAQDSKLRQHTGESERATDVMGQELTRYRSMPVQDVHSTILDQEPAGQPTATRDVSRDEAGGALLPQGTLSVTVLSEEEVQEAMGLAEAPDLDGNGDPSDSDRASYGVVPVRIRITWTAVTGDQRVEECVTFLYPRSTE